MLAKELYQTLDAWYPQSLRCEWDHDGIMCLPNPTQAASRVLVALDVTAKAMEYAITHQFDVIVSHHPFLFSPITSFDATNPTCKLLLKAIRHQIAIFSFHTRMDAALDGVNDALASALALQEVAPLDGLARIGFLSKPMTKEAFMTHLKQALSIETCRYSLGSSSDLIHRVALCGGSGKEYLPAALAAGADAFVSGELSYHTMLDVVHQPISVFACGHSDTELPICTFLQKKLQNEFSNLYVEAFVERHTF